MCAEVDPAVLQLLTRVLLQASGPIMDVNCDFRGTVVIFSRTNCFDSVKVRLLLREMEIPFINVPVDMVPQALEELKKFVSDEIVTPHIFFNAKHVEGYSALVQLTQTGTEWEDLIEMMKCDEADADAPHLEIIDEKRQLIKRSIDENQNQGHGHRIHYEWIPTEYEKLVSMMRKANLIKDNRVSLTKTYRNSFKGEDFVSWIIREKKIRRTEALELGQELVERHFNRQRPKDGPLTFSIDRYYQLIDESDSGPLNCSKPPTNEYPTNVGEFNDILCKIIEPVYDAILSPDRKQLFVELLEDNMDFKHYLTLMRETVNLDIRNASIPDRLAFFINCYNMQLIHILYKYGLPTNVWQRRRYMYSVYYQIGDHMYSLQSILNGILRGNRKGYKMLWRPFGKDDCRKPFIIPHGEPLVHFAVNNCTMSAPPIWTYSSENVMKRLKENAQSIMDQESMLRIDCKKNVVHLPMLFKIYDEDFGPTNDSLVEWIIDTMKQGQKRDTLIQMYYSGEYTINYTPIDLTSNYLREDS